MDEIHVVAAILAAGLVAGEKASANPAHAVSIYRQCIQALRTPEPDFSIREKLERKAPSQDEMKAPEPGVYRDT